MIVKMEAGLALGREPQISFGTNDLGMVVLLIEGAGGKCMVAFNKPGELAEHAITAAYMSMKVALERPNPGRPTLSIVKPDGTPA